MRGRRPKVVPADPTRVEVGPVAAARFRALGVPVDSRGERLFVPRWAAVTRAHYPVVAGAALVFRDVACTVVARGLGDDEALELARAAFAVFLLSGRDAARVLLEGAGCPP